MKINYLNLDFPITIIDGFYAAKELNLIWEELNFLCYQNKLKKPEQIGSAKKQSKIVSNRSGLFLHHCYTNPAISNILSINKKVLNHKQEIFINHDSWFFKNYKLSDSKTLISYYENSDYYALHKDNFLVTVLTWFFVEPKIFKGGELSFETKKGLAKIELVNNRLVAFPSCIRHQVSEIKMQDKYLGKKLGRFCMTQFFNVAG